MASLAHFRASDAGHIKEASHHRDGSADDGRLPGLMRTSSAAAGLVAADQATG